MTNGFVCVGGVLLKEAFHVEKVVDPFTLQEVVGMVRHPGVPWVGALPKRLSKMGDDDWQSLGQSYLDELEGVQAWPVEQWMNDDVRKALRQKPGNQQCNFGWLPVTWKDAPPDSAPRGRRKPLGSLWVDREDDDQKKLTPRLLVLLAGSVVTKHQLQTGSDMGLRLVLHVHADHVRIHGVTLSGLNTDRALKVLPEPCPPSSDVYRLVKKVRKEVGEALDCGGSVWVGNLETIRRDAADERLIATGFALRWRRTKAQARAHAITPGRWAAPVRARTYDFRVELSLDRPSDKVRVVQVHRDFYVNSGAASAGQAPSMTDSSKRLRAFVQDAASKGSPCTLSERRSTLSDAQLDKFRDDILARLPRDEALRFSDAGSGALFEMRGATREGNLLGGSTVARNKAGVVKVSPDPSQAQSLAQLKVNGATQIKGQIGCQDDPDALPDPVIRSDEQASIDAHLRGAELFARMLAYGIKPKAYFRFAKLPLVQRARPEMRWAPDGELPNAEVRPFMGDAEADESSKLPPPNPRDPLQLLVKYGSADPIHRRKVPFVKSAAGDGRGDGRFKAQYLSVACDPRWAWHEFGHVLAFASTGELEFPFAHSPGDGLAAIAADPISRLATAKDPDAEIRHVTFPWIEVPGRSHGRSATRGYGWCGCRNLTRLDFTASLERYHHNYFGEQILSSSLFRLYRSLGGDTRDPMDDDIDLQDETAPLRQPNPDDERMRLSASDYCIYLIMRGISLLGPDSLAPARTPDQFVSALIEADLGTGAWDVTATWPFNRDEREMNRHGGRVHKVIRWAFEQQGLYATDDPQATSEEVGKPPAVDVFINDRANRRGGYAPLPLRHGIQDPEPWHADSSWLQWHGGQLRVKVKNRGHEAALQMRLRAWCAPQTTSEDQELWWTPMTTAVGLGNLAPRASEIYTLDLPQADKPVWVLVSVDVPADPSNLPQDAKEPPSSWPELLELVAHDNNLALAKL